MPLPSVQPTGPADAKILILGEALGKDEDIFRRPFVGAAGRLLRSMLIEAGLVRPEGQRQNFYTSLNDEELARASIRLDNVFMERPPDNKLEAWCDKIKDPRSTLPSLKPGNHLRPEYWHHLDELRERLRSGQHKIILAAGNTPLWFLTGTQKISRQRGFLLETEWGIVMPVYHPAAVLRNYPLRPITVADFLKAKNQLRFDRIIRPERELWIEPSIEDFERFINEVLRSAPAFAFDIETAGGLITCISFATPARGITVPFVDDRQDDGLYWRTPAGLGAALRLTKFVLEELPHPKIAQNGLYDVQWLWSELGIRVRNWCIDTMLLHWSMQPEMQKSLEFLASVYTNEAPWKFWHRSQTGKREE